MSSPANELPLNIKKIIIAMIIIMVSFAIIFISLGQMIEYILKEKADTNLIFTITGILSFLWMVLIFIMGEWAAKYDRKPKLTPINMQDLRQQILDLSYQMPISIEQISDKKLKITWNFANKSYKHLVGIGKINSSYELLLKFDNKNKKILSGETTKNIKISASGAIIPKISFKGSFFKGITLFQSRYTESKGFKIENGKIFIDTLYQYSFDPNEVKLPIIATIIENGWEYCPKVFLI